MKVKIAYQHAGSARTPMAVATMPDNTVFIAYGNDFSQARGFALAKVRAYLMNPVPPEEEVMIEDEVIE